jgi:hypothetical protein
MAERNLNRWQINRQVNLSFLVQLIFLATLIVGSWVNIQRQLDFLQHDVSALLQCQKDFRQKLEGISDLSIAYDYRLRSVEQEINGQR